MLKFQLSLALPLVVAALASAAPLIPENNFPISFVGSITAEQATSGDTRIYYQNPDNSINELSVSGPFVSGQLYRNEFRIPAAQVLAGTPISSAQFGTEFDELHVFFVSPGHILSEWIWSSALGLWQSGPTCSNCITASGFVVQPGSQILYAIANTAAGSPALLRVAFISGGAPDTLSEASFTAANGWQLGQLNT
ncbi:hypothetical protein B0H19DRAFT_1065884 [Mycena capillaripes]|nr:hypothetical protein B0H19DRAFT_1065884 [Mycena capillaripes]